MRVEKVDMLICNQSGVGLHYNGEHLTPLAVDDDPPAKMHNGRVLDSNGKILANGYHKDI